MGRGNWLPNSSEITDYAMYYVDVCGLVDVCASEQEFFWEDLVNSLKAAFERKYKNMFPPAKKWDRDCMVLLENNLVQVVLADNGWAVAVAVVVPDNERFQYPQLGCEMLKYYDSFLKKTLTSLYPGQIYVRTGPWTSAKLKTAV